MAMLRSFSAVFAFAAVAAAQAHGDSITVAMQYAPGPAGVLPAQQVTQRRHGYSTDSGVVARMTTLVSTTSIASPAVSPVKVRRGFPSRPEWT